MNHDKKTPDHIYYYEDGTPMLFLWGTNEHSHRENGPARMFYYPNGTLGAEIWFTNGKNTRKPGDGPSVVTYHDNGKVCTQQWTDSKGRLSRKGAPATVVYTRDGFPQQEEWLRKGELHRKDGPACIIYDLGGKDYFIYFERGKFIVDKTDSQDLIFEE